MNDIPPPVEVVSQPPGWYPDPRTPGYLRYWDGAAWGAVQPMAAPSQVVVNAGGGPRVTSIGGLTYGQHLRYALLTVCTGGIWAPVWIMKAFGGRRRVVSR